MTTPVEMLLRRIASRNCLVNVPASVVPSGDFSADICIKLSWLEQNEETIAFVGHSRLPSRTDDAIEVDASFAASLELTAPVHVSVFQNYSVATTVSVEPIHVNDWEILERNAEFIEQQMINQIRFVYPGLIFPLHIQNTAKILLKVINVLPASQTSPCYLLAPDSEVVVAPKPRQKASLSIMETNKFLTRIIIKEHSSAIFTVLIHPTDLHRHLQVDPSTGIHILKITYTQSKKTSSIYTAFDTSAQVPPGHLFMSSALANASNITPLTRTVSTVLSIPKIPTRTSITFSLAHPTDSEEHLKETLKDLLNSQLDHGPIVLTLGTWMHLPSLKECMFTSQDSDEAFILIPSPTSLSSLCLHYEPKFSSKMTPPEMESSSLTLSPESLCALPSRKWVGTQDIFQKLMSALCFATQSTSLLLCGKPKSGKTSLLMRIALEAQHDRDLLLHTLFVDARPFKEMKLSSARAKLEHLFEQAKRNQPSLLIFDHLDAWLHGEQQNHEETLSLRHATVFTQLYLTYKAEARIHLMAASDTLSRLHPHLMESALFDDVHTLPCLSKSERIAILEECASRKQIKHEVDWMQFVSAMDGYVPADLEAVLDRSLQHALISDASKTTLLQKQHVQHALDAYVPLHLMDVSTSSPESAVRWDDVGGMDLVKSTLIETLQFPTKYAKLFSNVPLRLRSGILLYGFPGCGKTMIAHAVAEMSGCKFIGVKGPELLNKYIGQSEQSVRDVFERARSAAPCVLFFDEFDSIAPRRGHDNTGVTDRVVNQFLTEMDGAQGLKGVYVLAATSRPDLIDSALLRPGRLDKSLFCDYPDAKERFDILGKATQSMQFEDGVDLMHVAKDLEGYSGADLQAVIAEAHRVCIQEFLVHAHGKHAKHVVVDKEGKRDAVVRLNGRIFAMKELPRHEKEEIREKLMQLLKDADSTDEAKRGESALSLVIQQKHITAAIHAQPPALTTKEKERFRRIFEKFSNRDATPFEVGGKATLA